MWGIYMPRTIISESYDNSIFVFWRNQKHFPQELHPFTFPPAKAEGVISYMLIDTYYFSFKKNQSHPASVKQYLIRVLIFTSLMIGDDEYLFMYLLLFCTDSLEKHLFKSWPIFQLGCLSFTVEFWEFL